MIVNNSFKTIMFSLILAHVSTCTHAAVKKKTTNERIGDYTQIFLPTASAALTLYKEDYYGTLRLGMTLASTQAVVSTMKHFIHVTRPNNANDLSVISGHTAISFASSSFLNTRYGWKYSAPAYVLSAYVGYTRVQSEQHRWSEVIGGAFLGWGCGYLMTHIPLSGDKKMFNYKFKDVSFQLLPGYKSLSVIIN